MNNPHNRDSSDAYARCSSCGAVERFGVTNATARLTALGMLKRNSDADAALVFELLASVMNKLACVSCGDVQLKRCQRPANYDDDFDWPEAKQCLDCGTVIPLERLEVLPHAVLCAECQGRDDRGVAPQLDEFCSKCGDRLQIRGGGSAITRYSWYCPTCRR